MKKMPTLFKRDFKENGRFELLPEVSAGCEWVINGEGIATEKIDGSCCAIINGVFYKRYDAKKGKMPPPDAIPCQEQPDEITGHWPHWVPVDEGNPADKWFIQAFNNAESRTDGTYEAIGCHFQNNPYGMLLDTIELHGKRMLEGVPRNYEGIKEYLREHCIEGIVFHRENGEMCKIKRSDFGFDWAHKKSNAMEAK